MERYDANYDYQTEFIDRWNDGIRGARMQMAVLGGLLVAVGALALFAPFGLYSLFQTLAAVALIAYGGMQVIGDMRAPEMFRSPAMLASGIVNALLGMALIVLPSTVATATMGFVLAFLLVAFGAERVSAARRMRYFGVTGSTPVMALGVVNIVLGAVFAFAPMAAGVAFSYVMSAYLLIGGVGLLVQAASMRPVRRIA